jgi:hypothetical protein
MKTPTLPTRFLLIDDVVAAFPTIRNRQQLYDGRCDGRAPGSMARNVGGRLVWDPDELAEWWAARAPKTWPPEDEG